jgi:hypothetical protein
MTPTPRSAFITIVTTLVYLGLAVLGWGGFAAFFSHPPFIVLANVLLVLSGVALFSEGNLSPGEREDRANRWVLAAFAPIGLLMAYLPAYTDRQEFWPSTEMPFGGSGSCSSPAVVRCGFGQCLCSAVGSAGWWPSSRAYAGHERCLWRHPPPQLSGLARQLAGVGAGLSFGRRRAANGAPCPAAPRPHTRGGEAAAYAVRRGVRCLLQPHVAVNSGDVFE